MHRLALIIMFDVCGAYWSHTHYTEMQSSMTAPLNRKPTDNPICVAFGAKDIRDDFCSCAKIKRACPVTCNDAINGNQDSQSCKDHMSQNVGKNSLCNLLQFRLDCPRSCVGVRRLNDDAWCKNSEHQMGTFVFCNYHPLNRDSCAMTCNGVSTTVENYTGSDGDGQQCKDVVIVMGLDAFCASESRRRLCPITCKKKK